MTELQKKYLALRKSIIEKEFSRMNNMQLSAVTTAIGPVLILAGAGSGKTTVLVNRIAYLVKYGNAYNSEMTPGEEVLEKVLQQGESADYSFFSVDPPKPWEILAITFTNKAAGELKDRIETRLGESAQYIKAGTFHSVCSKILRRDAERLGYDSHYTIYDQDDQKRLMKQVCKELNIDEKQVPLRSILNAISHAKDSLISPEEFLQDAGSDVRLKLIAKAYNGYQTALKEADAMDFDDLIANTVKLFSENPDVLDYYRKRISYVMVDEYQDTNHAQYMFVKLLSGEHRNICVVGDDDQSIYRFRGATIENILSFEKEYPDATVIRLEQNYRSTQNILDAANAVISHNFARTGKSLWTDNGCGNKINCVTLDSEREEARFVADKVLEHIRNGGKYSDCAVLYRMNAQSNVLESVFVRLGIPYRVVGGMRFYDRKEIKDIIAYLNLLNNTSDNIRLRRIINEPKRGIGDTTLSYVAEIAAAEDKSYFDIMEHAKEYPTLSRAAEKMQAFCSIIRELQRAAEDYSLTDLLQTVIQKTGYGEYLNSLPIEESDRAENVKELATSVTQYELENEEASLSGFLEEVALVSDMDSYDTEADATVLMTLHSAKGLEFNTVFLVGMEEGIFPSGQTIYGGPEEMEEERRIAYVGITRAKKELYITNTFRRMIYGQTSYNKQSRFVNEIPKALCNCELKTSSSPFSSGSTFRSVSHSAAQTSRPQFNTSATRQSKPQLNVKFNIGDTVHHGTFGDGTVLKATPMGNDVLLEIDFPNTGKKKLMAAFAKLTKN